MANVDISGSLQDQINGINNSLSALQNEDTAQTTLNNQFTSDITALQTGKQNTIDVNNKISSLHVSYNATTVKDEFDALSAYHTSNDATISGIQTSITNLQNNKQDLINAGNKLSIDNINLGTSPLSFVDIDSSLQTDLNTITNDISTINTSLTTANTNITNLDTKTSQMSYTSGTDLTVFDSFVHIRNPMGTGYPTTYQLQLNNNHPTATDQQVNLSFYCGTIQGQANGYAQLGDIMMLAAKQGAGQNGFTGGLVISQWSTTKRGCRIDLTGSGTTEFNCGNFLINNTNVLAAISNSSTTITQSSNEITLDVSVARIFYVSNVVTGNFNVNIINFPASSPSDVITLTIYYRGNYAGTTANVKNTNNTTIIGSANPKWAGGVPPSTNASTCFKQTFTVLQGLDQPYLISEGTRYN